MFAAGMAAELYTQPQPEAAAVAAADNDDALSFAAAEKAAVDPAALERVQAYVSRRSKGQWAPGQPRAHLLAGGDHALPCCP